MRGGKVQFTALKENSHDEASRTLLTFGKQMTAFFVVVLYVCCYCCFLFLFFLSFLFVVVLFGLSSSSSSNKRTHIVAHHADAHRVTTGTVSDKAKDITP